MALTWPFQIIRVECRVRKEDAITDGGASGYAPSIKPLEPTQKTMVELAQEAAAELAARPTEPIKTLAELAKEAAAELAAAQDQLKASAEARAKFEGEAEQAARSAASMRAPVHDRGYEHVDQLAKAAIQTHPQYEMLARAAAQMKRDAAKTYTKEEIGRRTANEIDDMRGLYRHNARIRQEEKTRQSEVLQSGQAASGPNATASSTQPPRPAKTAFSVNPLAGQPGSKPATPSGPFTFGPRAFAPPRFGESAAVAPDARMSVPPIDRPGYVPTSFTQSATGPAPFGYTPFARPSQPPVQPNVFVGSGQSVPTQPGGASNPAVKPLSDAGPSFHPRPAPAPFPAALQAEWEMRRKAERKSLREVVKAHSEDASKSLRDSKDVDVIARVQTMLDKFMRELDSTLAPANLQAVMHGERLLAKDRSKEAVAAGGKEEDASVKMPGAFKVEPSSASARPLGVHKGYLCDGCDQEIKGVRYRCANCHDFDLCDLCLGKGRSRAPHQPHHTLRPIQPPGVCVSGSSFSPAFRKAPRPASTTPTPAPVVHNATCDLCDAKIIGTRWRCLSCPDFDACAACHSSLDQLHPIHAFAPITDAAISRSLVRTLEATVPHLGVTCDSCQRPIRGIRYKCTHADCPDFDLVRPTAIVMTC